MSRSRRSPSDVRREARRNTERLSEARSARVERWQDGGNIFTAARLEDSLKELGGEKRGLRREIYLYAPQLEGQPFLRGNHWRRHD